MGITTVDSGDFKDPKIARRLLSSLSAIPEDKIFLMNQVHSDKVAIAEEGTSLPKADALVIGNLKPPYACVVRVADCMPLFIISDGVLVGCVHAGWRPLAGGIIQNTVKLTGSSIHIYAGPHICYKCFEVGEEVQEFFPPASRIGNRISLFNALEKISESVGIKASDVLLLKAKGYCSIENPAYFSHRGGDNKRMAAFAFQY